MTARGGSPASSPTATARPSYARSTLPPAVSGTSTCSAPSATYSAPITAACSRAGRNGCSASLTHVSRVLLVTNDFPPRPGGIQSYLGEFVGRLVGAGSHSVIVYAPQWKGGGAHDAA